MFYQRKKKNNSINKIAIFIIILILAGSIPSVSYAMRRKHRYHSRKSTITKTISPVTSITPMVTKTQLTDATNLLAGTWEYLPGAILNSEGLMIQETGLAIVNQEGNESIPNAPINLAGTYMKDISGDYTLTAGLKITENTTATIQLYSNPPVIADEFRIEKPSIQFVFNSGRLEVRVWDGSGQIPSLRRTFTLPESKITKLSLLKVDNNFRIDVNDVTVGDIEPQNFFASGKIWFGFDSLGGDWLLTDLGFSESANGKMTIADGSILKIEKNNPEGLQALVKKQRPDFLVGMALALGPAVGDSEYSAVAFDKSMFGSMTLENDLKMINIQPKQGLYTFQKADALIKLAKQNGVTDIHGHALVFGEANPLWFNNLPLKTSTEKQQIEKIMVDQITTVIQHFGNEVQSWDVVNEPIADYDDFDLDSGKVMREHKWYQAMGESYIIKAFETAYKANPNLIYSINEYGLEEDGERWDAFLDLLRQLKKDLQIRNIPLTNISVGFQAHVYESGDRINPAVLREHIRTLADLGFKAQISEMDVYTDDGITTQARQYADVFQVCLTELNCLAWRGWMLTDRYDVWMDDDGTIQYGKDGLYNNKMLPRPAITAIQQVITSDSSN